ncbi:Hypothetical protein I595_1688 [Croceitalea dokdonensis DOKDO 023]|uniref:Uncharacterized protein n=1 Tax=Croceitalea dokdonensis DOKDO 023 TaxID=1300341 RepID=A0A0P7B1W6_9FLAO|nr:Hypothetical protein I595_1688 [Croceitalea dokdonensis DOKDO 023]
MVYLDTKKSYPQPQLELLQDLVAFSLGLDNRRFGRTKVFTKYAMAIKTIRYTNISCIGQFKV